LFIYLAWMIEGLISFVKNTRSQLTLETLKVMKAESKYSNTKIIKELGFEYRSLDETMEYCIKHYVDNYR
jgi:hypothetical protein